MKTKGNGNRALGWMALWSSDFDPFSSWMCGFKCSPKYHIHLECFLSHYSLQLLSQPPYYLAIHSFCCIRVLFVLMSAYSSIFTCLSFQQDGWSFFCLVGIRSRDPIQQDLDPTCFSWFRLGVLMVFMSNLH